MDNIIKLLINCVVEDGFIKISRDFFSTLEIIKKYFNFDCLEEIYINNNFSYGIELIYLLYSSSENYSILLSTQVCNKAESIISLYPNALDHELYIKNKYNIEFI